MYVSRPQRETPYGVTRLGDRLFAARREILGCSQDVAAERAGMRRVHYLQIENGENSGDSVSRMQGIARAFGVGLEALLRYLHGEMSLKEFAAQRGKAVPSRGTLISLSDRIGLPVDVVVTLSGETCGEMDELKPNVRKAVMGLVHLLGYPIETVVKAATEALEGRGDMGLEPEALASIIRPKLPHRPPSGTHPSSSKIKLTG